MNLILTHELRNRCERELSVLFLMVSREMAKTARCSPERRNALASLENISRARMQRMTEGPA
ncbi:MAG TPA: hypothetical protein VIS74_02955 [Chthoniobacterales bacterium]